MVTNGGPMEITEELAGTVLALVDAGLVGGLGSPTPGAMCVEAAVCYAMGLPHSDQPSCVSPAVRITKIYMNDWAWGDPAIRAAALRRVAIAQLGSRDVIDEGEFARRLMDRVVRRMLPDMWERYPRWDRSDAAAAWGQMPAAHVRALRSAARTLRALSPVGETNPPGGDVVATLYATHAALRIAGVCRGFGNDVGLGYLTSSSVMIDHVSRPSRYPTAACRSILRVVEECAVDVSGYRFLREGSINRQRLLWAECAEHVVQILIEMQSPGTRFLYLAPDIV